jgi:hypothetical protein
MKMAIRSFSGFSNSALQRFYFLVSFPDLSVRHG